MNTEENIKVMQAFSQGKKVEQVYRKGDLIYREVIAPTWNWDKFSYRLKKEEKEAIEKPFKNNVRYAISITDRGSVRVNRPLFELLRVDQKLILACSINKSFYSGDIGKENEKIDMSLIDEHTIDTMDAYKAKNLSTQHITDMWNIVRKVALGENLESWQIDSAKRIVKKVLNREKDKYVQ